MRYSSMKFLNCKVLIAVLSIIISAMGLELSIRAFGLLDFPLYYSDSYIGYRIAPNQSGAFLNKNDWKFDDLGMAKYGNFSSSSENIIIVGDSIVLGGNQFKDNDKLGAILSNILNRNVSSAAAGSWSLLNELAFLREKYTDISKIKDIVFVLNSDDFNYPSVWASQLSHPTQRPVFGSVYLFRKYIFPKVPPGSVDDKSQRSWVVEWENFLNSNKSRIFVLIYPTRKQFNDEQARDSELLVHADELRKVSGDRINLIEVGSSNGWRLDFYSDNIHPNVEGNKVLAEIIAQALRR